MAYDSDKQGSELDALATLLATTPFLVYVPGTTQIETATPTVVKTYLEGVLQNLTNLGDLTFQTGASGGTLRTGTSAADKFVLQAYDVDGSAYLTMLEVDAGNTPLMSLLHVTEIDMDNAGVIQTGTAAGENFLIRARDVDGASWKTFATITANNTPTMDLDADVTKNSKAILTAGKQTMWVPAAAMRPTASNGCAALTDVETTAGRPDMTVLDFDPTADEHAQFQVGFPKSWNLGTITFQAFWTTTATDTDGVAWGLQGVAVSDGDSIDVAYGTAVVVTDAGQSTAEDLYVTSESAAVTIAGTPADDDLCYFRIFRDVSNGSDTMTEDARLIGIKLFYTTDAASDD